VLKTQNDSIRINTTATEKAIELIDEAEVSGLQLIDNQSLDRASIEDALKACLISA